jgi:hypothetical protein
MKFKVGDLVVIKPRGQTRRGLYREESYRSVAIVTRVYGKEYMNLRWVGEAKGKQADDGGYYPEDFVLYLNGLQLAIKKAKEL